MKSNAGFLVACAVAGLPLLSPGMEYGVCAHVAREEFGVHEREFDLMAKAGVKWVRTDFTWAQIERSPGVFDFAKCDRVVADAEKRGLKVLPILCYDNESVYHEPAHVRTNEWARFVAVTVYHYRGRLDVFEIWNEPNLGIFWKPSPDAGQYTSLLKCSYRATKAANPRAVVLMGGLAGADCKFLEGVYKSGGREFMDAVNIHPYCWPNPPGENLASSIGRIRDVMARHGDARKPLWITEIGWPTHKADVSGMNLVRSALAVARPGRREWRIAVASVAEQWPNEAFTRSVAEALPPGSSCVALADGKLVEELRKGVIDAVMLPKEAFPADAMGAIRDFVAGGGVLIATGGVPMYYAYRDGKRAEGVDCEAARRSLRIGWKAWWFDADMPEKTRVFATDAAIASGFKADPAGFDAGRFFTRDLLKPGDRMVPLLVGRDKKGRDIASGAVYLLGSDMKGAVVVSSGDDLGCRTSSEEEQARYIVDAASIADKCGIAAFFVYELQAPEHDPHYSEHHFGICHRDLSPKPAFEAYGRHISESRARCGEAAVH